MVQAYIWEERTGTSCACWLDGDTFYGDLVSENMLTGYDDMLADYLSKKYGKTFIGDAMTTSFFTDPVGYL